MSNRKDFLKLTGALAFGSLVLPRQANAFYKNLYNPPPGLQLFTFFSSIDDDVSGTLKKIAAIGYKEIESAFSKKGGFYGMKPKEFAALVNSMGMSWKSHHVVGAPFKMPPGAKMPTGADGKPMTIPPMKNLKENMQELIDQVAEGGVEYLVCASTPISSLDEVKGSIEVLNKTDEACKKAGIGFVYHNHDAEFKAVDGQIPYELFLSQTKMKMELDLAWAIKGGKDPVELFKQNPGRFPLWHVKDLDATKEIIMPVGEGTIDYKRIFDAASTAGLKYYFIEHDFPKDAYASITTSYNSLTKMLK
jgi:sugar phosphate isomerase/epimerase